MLATFISTWLHRRKTNKAKIPPIVDQMVFFTHDDNLVMRVPLTRDTRCDNLDGISTTFTYHNIEDVTVLHDGIPGYAILKRRDLDDVTVQISDINFSHRQLFQGDTVTFNNVKVTTPV